MKLGVVGLLWKKVSQYVPLTIITFLVLIFISLLHNDYLSYVNFTDESDNISTYFLIKWLAYFTTLCIYCLAVFRINKTSSRKKYQLPKVSNREDIISNYNVPLRSQGDFIIESKPIRFDSQ